MTTIGAATASSSASGDNTTSNEKRVADKANADKAKSLVLDLTKSDTEVFSFLQDRFSDPDLSPAMATLYQSYLEKRTQMAGLISNLLQKLAEAAKAIIQNIGR